MFPTHSKFQATTLMPLFSQGVLRSECTTEVIMAGFIWDNMPLVEKAIDAIDFTRIREGVKINKFPGFLDLNRWDFMSFSSWKSMLQERHPMAELSTYADKVRQGF